MTNKGIEVRTNTLANSELYKVEQTVKHMASNNALLMTIMGCLNRDFNVNCSVEGKNYILTVDKRD